MSVTIEEIWNTIYYLRPELSRIAYRKHWESYWYWKFRRDMAFKKYAPKNYRGKPKKKKKSKYRLAVGAIGPETKWTDNTWVPAIGTGGGTQSQQLTNTAQGDGENQFTGNRYLITAASCILRATCASTTTGSGAVRCILVYGKNPLSIFPSGFEVLQDLAFTQDTVVLYDKIKEWDANSRKTIVFRGHCKMHHQYNDNAGWNVYMIVKATAMGTAAMVFNAIGRVSFKDP